MHPPSPADQPARAWLRVDVHREGEPPGVRVGVAGELDLATAPLLQAELDALVDDGYCELDVDLGEVSFCDVAGLDVLMRAHAAAVAAGGRLSLHGGHTLRVILRVLRLEETFEPIPRNGEPAGDEA